MSWRALALDAYASAEGLEPVLSKPFLDGARMRIDSGADFANGQAVRDEGLE
jgi:hypothetical protein